MAMFPLLCVNIIGAKMEKIFQFTFEIYKSETNRYNMILVLNCGKNILKSGFNVLLGICIGSGPVGSCPGWFLQKLKVVVRESIGQLVLVLLPYQNYDFYMIPAVVECN